MEVGTISLRSCSAVSGDFTYMKTTIDVKAIKSHHPDV